MAQLDRQTLQQKINTKITSNGLNQITGAILNEILNDLKDSYLNLADDSQSLGANTGTAQQFIDYMDTNLNTIQ